MPESTTPKRHGLGRLRWLVIGVIAVCGLALAAVVLLQAQARDAHHNEMRARVYAVRLQQSINDLLPVGYALADQPELLQSVVGRAMEQGMAEVAVVRTIDPARAHTLDVLIGRVRERGLSTADGAREASARDVTSAARVANEIANGQRERAHAAEVRMLVGTGGALAFAILAVILLVTRDRRRSIADASAQAELVRRLAEHDALTDLPNRRRLESDVAALAPEDGPVEIAVCDLNDFKAINDRLGHDAGDAVLITVARDLSATVGAAGTVYRIGGDQFAVVSGPGQRVADLVRQTLERDGSGTVGSVGAASFPTDRTTVREVMRLADRRMYAAKQAQTWPVETPAGQTSRIP